MAQSFGADLADIQHKAELEARNMSYGAATQLLAHTLPPKSAVSAEEIVKCWIKVADGVYAKIRADLERIYKE